MGKKFGLRITTLIMASIILIGSSSMASAATSRTCNHKNIVRKGIVVDQWNGYHIVTMPGLNHPITCYYALCLIQRWQRFMDKWIYYIK